MYPALNGDAFLISSERTNILVDGGYAQTFDEHISHDLKDLSNKGESLDLLITTHIDADHILGVIRLLSLNGSFGSRQIVPIENIWHNSLRSLTSRSDAKFKPSDQEILNAIRQRGHPTLASSTASSATEISARQGSTLASLIHNGGYQWNGDDGTTCISVEHTRIFNLPDGNIHVITPTESRLDELLTWWKRQLRRMGYTGSTEAGDVVDDAFEFMCEYASENITSKPIVLSAGRHKKLEEAHEPDTSITNGSSIATIIELGGVRILMLADAWAEDVVQQLQALQSNGYSMIFDAIKISHHGSLRNTSPELLQLVDAPIYIISSNGAAHGHPDIEVLTAIVDRPAPFSRTLYFNYATPASNLIRNHRSSSEAPFIVHDNATDWIEIQKSQN